MHMLGHLHAKIISKRKSVVEKDRNIRKDSRHIRVVAVGNISISRVSQ
jgi:hypothetical protein